MQRQLPLGIVVVVTATGTLRFVCFAAWGTTPRLIGKTFGLEELLFPRAEGEICSTVGTKDGFVLKTHWMTSSLTNLVGVWGHPILNMNLGGYKKFVIT
jgi:hypothetical protein